METYEDKIMCAKCGGSCCKFMGCIYSLRQFFDSRKESLTTKKINEILKQGNVSIAGQPINNFCGDNWTFILYLKARDDEADVVDILGKGGPCVNLSDSGCKLEKSKRPLYGKTVKPTKVGGPCEQTALGESFVYDCLLFHDKLAEILEKYTGMEAEVYLLDRLTEDSKYLGEKIKNKEKLTDFEKEKYNWYLNIVNNKPYVDSKFALDWINSCMGF